MILSSYKKLADSKIEFWKFYNVFIVVEIRTLLKNVGTITISDDSRMAQKSIDCIIRHNLWELLQK
ncbi:hypothetical protein B1J93_00535 [Leptospira kirschneri serovar Pomona]|uniref:Uncharacterized protein n=1 Tax=Leptospira kirschneri serovar Pomona TaxID=561005 RepID=A0A1T1E4E5_9LEPT|nr:hypothetical protein LEP1GSC166_0812 [Leptospira kirschneri]KXZ29896.1 hypothetical protein AYB32_08800 [Leptospira kirschneri]KXZ32782.1 hypothetical protein AYB34_12640 [Leptospira sp. ZV016]OOV47952.1 hypothetical protein B1J93_00535 [Leptospira kirschneri serovar Pomona]